MVHGYGFFSDTASVNSVGPQMAYLHVLNVVTVQPVHTFSTCKSVFFLMCQCPLFLLYLCVTALTCAVPSSSASSGSISLWTKATGSRTSTVGW